MYSHDGRPRPRRDTMLPCRSSVESYTYADDDVVRDGTGGLL